MSKMNTKSSKILDKTSFGNIQSPLKTKTPTAKIKQKIAKCSPAEEENAIYVSQLQELARYFSSIESSGIRQYGINLMRELAKCESEERAKAYADEMMS
jgi:hypothetical protein